MKIRMGTIEDVTSIAQVHVASWQTTYKGIISDDYLNNLSVESRLNNWIGVFQNPKPDHAVIVVENDDGAIVGFTHGGKCRSEQYNFDSEVYSIYLLKEYQGQGYGKVLFSTLINHLKLHNYHSCMLWVLADNSAKAFYSSLGGKIFAEKDIQIGNDILKELAFGWDELV
ncbi:GNAT family N-acetyltransferase [Paenibacillus sp. FJAT-27812]|uniref:GNAT family N-acetyltransferase n=1 Tax=Paenibacillus sp. FJAT-27812 TaxID=1684143 RepID=UPI0006A75B94|nr:GNAT family N-acetyltransferase [Paenibacillus sp. FJAT-27812]